MKDLPYGDIFYELLGKIHAALAYCHLRYSKNETLSEDDQGINEIFESFSKISPYRISGLNSHIVKGLTLGDAKRQEQNLYPRLSKLVIYTYLQAQSSKRDKKYKAEIIPSPLNILYHALTVPNEPQSAAYAYVLCRSMLFFFLQLHPKLSGSNSINATYSEFQEEDILRSMNSLGNYSRQFARWPDKRQGHEKDAARLNYLLGHILALKGFFYLWFSANDQLINFCNVNESNLQSDLYARYRNELKESEKYHFRLSGGFHDMPDSSEVLNWIFGIPIPIRGADLLFSGGLKRSSNSGLVVSMHGQPGTGKTSVALALASVLSPFNTQTIYITLEESPEDLRTRLNTLTPSYLKRLSIYENNYNAISRKANDKYSLSWFHPYEFRGVKSLNDLERVLQLVSNKIEGAVSNKSPEEKGENLLPAICPLLLVVDNINGLLSNRDIGANSYYDIEQFVKGCRDIGAIVLLISAEGIPERYNLDYLVDVALCLKQEGIESKYEKPVRILQLTKSRHQLSRQGSHVFHISNDKGLRISPQVPSQLDKREKLRIQLPSKKMVVNALNFHSRDGESIYYNFLNVAENSQILIHGYGSSGKAGFGLKLLMTPIFESRHFPKSMSGKSIKKYPIGNRRVNKVMILSFLYPDEYYQGLYDRIVAQFDKMFDGYDRAKAIMVVKSFYPGYLTPEDFVNKIVRMLEEARLEGEPFTGILIDGLHNVFLQFRYLQDFHMIWPLLYNMLSRYSLTVVSTSTNFTLNQGVSAGDAVGNAKGGVLPEDLLLMQQGQRPFLHGLVKAADYFFLLDEESSETGDKRYMISVRSSIRQAPPTDRLRWDRSELVIIAEEKGGESQ